MKQFIFRVFILFLFTACSRNKQLFELVDAQKSGITFNNKITINDTINILDNEFTYNGAGVAVGDLNGDGLLDAYFCGNQVENKFYLNRGNLNFEDVTIKAGVQKYKGQWSSGVTIVDINQDGLQDIYVCNTMIEDSIMLRDNLFINQGNNSEGIPTFKEMGADYGILDDTHNSISTFFDYDNDGDLDLFVAVNFIDMQYPNQFITRFPDGKSLTRDLLYRNDFDSIKGHPVFKDVSLEAGIVWGGYSHSALIHDFNQDGFEDIFVANDYLSNDLLYINNKNGTFTNQVANVFKHQSYSSMGSDVADINNDGHGDLFTVEMLPQDNKRKKVNMNANNYNHYLFTEQYNYEYQFVRNAFQVYQGINPETRLPLYSDFAFMAGVEATDWSWSPLFADFDNDGYKDLLITNGFPKDIIDHDFGAFRKSISSSLITRKELLDMIPEVKIPNYIYKNNGNLTFTDKSKEWGISLPSFTNGTAYADLDNDGDLDILTNNIDDPAFLFENTLYKPKQKEIATHFMRIKLSGSKLNQNGFGTRVTIWHGNNKQVAESQCVRGYLSTSEPFLHFGLGVNTFIDSIRVEWQDGRVQTIGKQNADQTILLEYKDAKLVERVIQKPTSTWVKPVDPLTLGIEYVYEENDFIDFNLQKTLPHKFSQYGPAIAVGDVNGDQLDDVVLSSSSRFQGPVVLIQQPGGRFKKMVLKLKSSELLKEEDMGLLLFDADKDGDNDLYIVRGSYQHDEGSPLYQDILCENDGKGNFTIVASALPAGAASGQNIKAADIDRDGDLDLFVGGRVKPKAYPLPGESFLLRNDSKPGKLQFTDVSEQWFTGLKQIGMVSDALWTDFDNDQQMDLVLACEWSPLIFLKNTGKSFERIKSPEIDAASGWWNSLTAADFDLDGDMDYVAGNFGLNQYFKCSSDEPIRIYSKDFDQNGSYDAFISCYFPDSSGKRNEYFYHSKDDMQKQLILIRKKFEHYADFGRATVNDVFTSEEMKGVEIRTSNHMQSSWIENMGGGQFRLHVLPMEAQTAPLYGMQTRDINGDLLPDLLLVGNDYGMETSQGRADAINGLVLINNGKKNFIPSGFEQSGFFVPGDARALTVANINNSPFLIATENRKPLRLFRLPEENTLIIALLPGETFALQTHTDNRIERIEFSNGSSFLSQRSNNWFFSNKLKLIVFYDAKGKKTRTINPQQTQ
jgi:hypothetical protein